MNHASLFSGIGGFDLAAEWMGWTNVLHCERDPFCQRVLKYHFPNAKTYNDVKTFNGTKWRGRVDILTGGFPCQPYSSAGKRLGKDDERHLWPEMCRIISEITPAYVVGENVRGLLNWNGGVVFEEVCADLEAMGYEVWTGVLPAAGVGAPHRRDRIWWVAANAESAISKRTRCSWARRDGFADNNCDEVAANTYDVRLQHAAQPGSVGASEGEARGRVASSAEAISSERNATDTNRGRLEGTTQSRRHGIDVEREGITWNASDTHSEGLQGNQLIGAFEGREWKQGQARFPATQLHQIGNWEEFPTQPPVCGGDDGLPRELDGITFPKWRAESIKAYGNAIVPQVAYQIFQAIQTTHDN